jgi:hypothetical protein
VENRIVIQTTLGRFKAGRRVIGIECPRPARIVGVGKDPEQVDVIGDRDDLGVGLVAFLDDGRIERDTNSVERVIRPITLTRKNALFAGSDGGVCHWTIAMTLIQSATLNGLEPVAGLADVLKRVVSEQANLHDSSILLP